MLLRYGLFFFFWLKIDKEENFHIFSIILCLVDLDKTSYLTRCVLMSS